MKLTNEVIKIIKSEPWLKNADETYVTPKWVDAQGIGTIRGHGNKIIALIIYSADDHLKELYIQMMWVKKEYRGQGLGRRVVAETLNANKKYKLVVAYANKHGVKVLKKLGFTIGKIEYRECFLRR